MSASSAGESTTDTVTHHVTVCYFNSDDGIWIECTCKDERGLHWQKRFGWDPTPAQLWAGEQEHMREVGALHVLAPYGTLILGSELTDDLSKVEWHHMYEDGPYVEPEDEPSG